MLEKNGQTLTGLEDLLDALSKPDPLPSGISFALPITSNILQILPVHLSQAPVKRLPKVLEVLLLHLPMNQ